MIVFDCETTGLIENLTTRPVKQPEVIEFCGISIDPYTAKVYDTYDQLIKPTLPISEEITKLNGIDNDMVDDAPVFKNVAASIRDMIEKADAVVAHNAAFDCDMINLEFARLQLTPVAWPHIICTVEQTTFITGYRMTLSDLYEYLFKERFGGAHRARADVEALCRCVVEMRKRNWI